jgi:hypothetical protein
VELPRQHGHHVHAGHRPVPHQFGDVVAAYFQANRLFLRHGRGLVGCLLQHGGKSEEVAVGGFVHHYLLLVFVGGGHARLTGHDHVTMVGGVAGLEDTLARQESLDLNLRRQNARFVVVEKLEKWNVP